MSSYPHPILAREGWPFLAIALAVAVALSFTSLWWLALLAWLGVGFVAQFFRDPPREVPTDADAVLAPADGRIVVVGKARDPYLDRDALKISVFMNVFNVHSNRSPVDGEVEKAWYSRRQLSQRGARQGVARERAQCAGPSHRRGCRRDAACRSRA